MAASSDDAPAPAKPQQPQRHNPLHGLTLQRIVEDLVAHYGWPGLAERVPLNCFASDPSVSSSLRFLRKTPWARDKVEGLYLYMQREMQRHQHQQQQQQQRRTPTDPANPANPQT